MARRTGAKAEATLADLERKLGHRFVRPELLTQALTHRSFVYDIPGSKQGADQADPSRDNEQLEFLGDAVLGLVVAEALCRRFPGSREGELTRLRANLVSRRYLSEVGMRLELGRWLRLGPTTEAGGGRSSAGLASNAMEAVLAALYLDGGLEAARMFVEREVLAKDAEEIEAGAKRDAKTILQEAAQAQNLGRPLYVEAGESGPAHRRVFRVEVRLEGPGAAFGILGEAEGSSKKQAQQEAAQLALAKLAESASQS